MAHYTDRFTLDQEQAAAARNARAMRDAIKARDIARDNARKAKQAARNEE